MIALTDGPRPQGTTISAGGVEVFVRRTASAGAGRPVCLLVHGHFGSSRNWNTLAGLLAEQLDCVAMDLPGFGRSPAPQRYSTQAAADCVAAVARELGGPVHLVGNSYGGTIAMWCAAQHPSLVKTLTVISPAIPVVPRRQHAMFSRLLTGAAGLRWQLARLDAQALAAQILSDCCADEAALSPAVIADATKDARDALDNPGRVEAESGSFRAMLATLLRSLLPTGTSLRRLAAQIRCPTLVLWGMRDTVLPVTNAARTARLIPSATVTVIPGAGHLPHLENPLQTATAIAKHVASPA